MESRFLCEECGKPVAFDAEICPWCHKKFSAVKCPKCGLVDQPVRFLNGCPSCGYLMTKELGAGRTQRKKNKKKPSFFVYNKKKKKYVVPLVIYRIAGVFIFILIVILIYLYMRSL